MSTQSSTHSWVPKWVIITILVCVILVVLAALFIAYWWVVAPIIARFSSHEDDIYWDLSYYTNGDYLDFEHGAEFQEMLQEWDVAIKGTPTDFYYIDNRIEDSPVYGKQIDIYILEIQMQEDVYLQEKALVEESCRSRDSLHDFTLYPMPLNSKLDTNIPVVAFCDIDSTARYILITDSDESNSPYQQLLLWAVLPWDASKSNSEP